MGLCGSGYTKDRKRYEIETFRSQKLEKYLVDAVAKEQEYNKLLLLGAGESGKSTLFKQCLYLFGKGYPPEERKRYVRAIWSNIIQSCKALIQFVLEHQSNRYYIQPHLNATVEYLFQMRDTDPITPEIAQHIDALWKDPAIQVAYQRRSEFQLVDSSQYFFDKVIEVTRTGYIPTPQDIFRARVRTTGIVETEFAIQGTKFRMFDVGGQRNERKKWIHCFENVTAVIFVAAMSVFDQVLFEDTTTNRMVEALTLFEEVCNSRWFANTSMILFLNKKDLYLNKIKRVPITVTFPNFPGNPHDFEETKDFLVQVFESRNHQEKIIYTHITCATDTDQMNHVFLAVKDIIIRLSLQQGGLMGGYQ